MPTVLIVDDHPTFRSTARQLLEAEGFDVIGEAEDGASALACVARLRPEVVLLDVQLPDMDGFEVSRLTSNGNRTQVVLVLEPGRVPSSGRSSRPPVRAASSRRASSRGGDWQTCWSEHPGSARDLDPRAGLCRGRRRARRVERPHLGEARDPPARDPDRPRVHRGRDPRAGAAAGEQNRGRSSSSWGSPGPWARPRRPTTTSSSRSGSLSARSSPRSSRTSCSRFRRDGSRPAPTAGSPTPSTQPRSSGRRSRSSSTRATSLRIRAPGQPLSDNLVAAFPEPDGRERDLHRLRARRDCACRSGARATRAALAAGVPCAPKGALPRLRHGRRPDRSRGPADDHRPPDLRERRRGDQLGRPRRRARGADLLPLRADALAVRCDHAPSGRRAVREARPGAGAGGPAGGRSATRRSSSGTSVHPGYVDVHGLPLRLPGTHEGPDDDTGRGRDLVHDAALADQPELEAVVHATHIALERGLSLRSLEASERRATALLDAIPDSMYRLSRDGTFLEFRLSETALSPSRPSSSWA